MGEKMEPESSNCEGLKAKTGTKYCCKKRYVCSFPHPINQVLRVELEVDGIGSDEQHQSQRLSLTVTRQGVEVQRGTPRGRRRLLGFQLCVCFQGGEEVKSVQHIQGPAAISSPPRQPHLQDLNPFTLERH